MEDQMTHAEAISFIAEQADRIAALEDHLAFKFEECASFYNEAETVIKQRDSLKAQLAECKKDAERYQFLKANYMDEGHDGDLQIILALRNNVCNSSL